MRVVICDDEGALAGAVEALAGRWSAARGTPCRVRTFASGEELLFETAGSYPYDLSRYGVDNGSYPLARTFLLSIKATF